MRTDGDQGSIEQTSSTGADRAYRVPPCPKLPRTACALEFKDITPLTVLLGPNGSGKSTVFDVFNFLSECFQYGLRSAWDRRGRAKELRTRGQQGPIMIELKYRDDKARRMTYHLAIDEERGKVFVAEEWLRWTRGAGAGRPFNFLSYKKGRGSAVPGEEPDEKAQRVEPPLRSPDLIAVNTLGQFADHPRVAALREFITDWYVSYLSVDETRAQPEAGPQERLSKTGGNVANVVQFLKEQHPDRLKEIFEQLQRRVPRIEKVIAEAMPDGRLLLEIKDAPFSQPILARFASDGTIGIGGRRVVRLRPSHTTGRAGSHPAVRRVEVSWQASGLLIRRSSCSAWRC